MEGIVLVSRENLEEIHVAVAVIATILATIVQRHRNSWRA